MGQILIKEQTTPATPATSYGAIFLDSADGGLKLKDDTGAVLAITSVISSVFGRTGVVVAVAGDYTASEVDFVPAGGLAATDVQAAIEELDTEKAPSSHVGSNGVSQHAVATGTDAGFMSTTDKTKLDGIASGATANDTDANLKNRANHTGTQLAATISDFSTAADARAAITSTPLSHVGSGGAQHAQVTTSVDGFMIAADKTKLDGIATGATANSSDATLLARANHTGTQLSSTISDFTEAAQDSAASLFSAGTHVGISFSYSDAGNAIDATNTDRGSTAVTTHEGLSDPHPQYLTSTEADALYDAIGAASTAQAFAIQRANHTGSQASSTISDFTEAAQDSSASLFTSATHDGVSVSYNDGAATLAITNTDKGSSAVTTHVGLADPHTVYQLKAALDTDGTLAANSDAKYPSQKAVKTYVDTAISGVGSVNSFATIATDSGTSPVADSSTDTLSLTSANAFLAISGNSTTDTVTFTVSGLEPALGNPSTNGYVLSSTTAGVRSWVAQSGGGGGSPGGATTQIQFNNSGAFDGDAGFTWDDTNKFIDMPTTYASGQPTIRLRDSAAAFLSGSAGMEITHSDGAGLSSVVAYNGAGLRLQALNAAGSTNFGQMVINSAATTVSTAGAARNVLVLKHAASGTGDYFSVQGSANTNPAFVIVPASSSDASARIGIQSTSAGLGAFVPAYPLEIAVEKYVDANSFIMRTTDGAYGGGTGGFQINPAASSGLGLFSFVNDAGATMEFKNAAGSTFYSIWRADTNGLTLRSGNSAKKPLVVKAEASHSTNLIEIQDSSAAVMASFDASGDLSVPMLSASQSVTFSAISSKSANYTLTAADYTVICDTTSASFTITLPAASGITGRIYNIKKMVAANTLTIDGNASETIDGSLTVDLFDQYSSITVQCTGSAWVII